VSFEAKFFRIRLFSFPLVCKKYPVWKLLRAPKIPKIGIYSTQVTQKVTYLCRPAQDANSLRSATIFHIANEGDATGCGILRA
jgi:hypothetical protein